MAKIARFPGERILRKPKKKAKIDILQGKLDFYKDQLHEMIEDYPELADLYWKVNDLRGEWLKELNRSV